MCFLLCIAQSKHRHVLSIVHCPIQTPPRAFYWALRNQTPHVLQLCIFLHQKKKLKSNVFCNWVIRTCTGYKLQWLVLLLVTSRRNARDHLLQTPLNIMWSVNTAGLFEQHQTYTMHAHISHRRPLKSLSEPSNTSKSRKHRKIERFSFSCAHDFLVSMYAWTRVTKVKAQTRRKR